MRNCSPVDRQLTLPYSLGRVADRLAHVLGFQVRVGGDDLGLTHSIGDRRRNPPPSHPRKLEKAGLTSLGFHEGRHTYASIAIAAGLNAKTLSTYLGHATITITLDRYGHLMPGSEVEARARCWMHT